MSNFLIDPQKMTDFNRSKDELEAALLFSICVAGKTASQICTALERFLDGYSGSPFDRIRKMIQEGVLEDRIKSSKLGKHKVLSKAFRQVAAFKLDLSSCRADQLEKICGVGLKTSRFFLLHTRKNANVAALDTHILKYLREHLRIDAPSATPSSSKKYRELEDHFIQHAKAEGKDPAELDLAIWNAYSKRSGTGQSLI